MDILTLARRAIPRPLAAALLLVSLMASASANQRGTVTTATIAPPSASVGAPVALSVTGRNPCNAVHIDWGDGNSLTYAIPDLTTTQKHTYDRPGNYEIVASGRGNCDGRTSLRVRIVSGPPQEAPQLSSFTVSIPAPVGSPVGVTAHGTGRCRMTVDFGDGESDELTVPLPHTVRHVYESPGTYTVVANATPPCEGRHSVKLDVGGGASGPRLLGMRIAPNPTLVRTPVAFTIDGRGTCAVTVDFGDGREQAIEAPLPARVSHTYRRPGVYEIFAWAEQPCTGETTGSVRVRPPRR